MGKATRRKAPSRSSSDLKQRIASMEQAEQRYRATLYSIGDGVIVTDADGCVVQLNPVAEALTGWNEADALGRSAEEVFHIVNEDTRADVESPIRRVLREGQIVGLANHTLLIARDGSTRPIADSGAPIRGADGTISGVVLVFRDQSDEREAAEMLRERVKELTCLQDLSAAVEAHENNLERILEAAVQILPRSWLHSDVAVARIQLDDSIYQTGEIEACHAVQAAEIEVQGEPRGKVQVGYREERPPRVEGPFLEEERALITAVAERLGHVAARVQMESELEHERSIQQTVFAGIDDVIYIADPESFELLYVNAAAEQVWGREWRGQKCHRYFQNRETPCPFCTNDKIFGEGTPGSYIWEFQNEVTRNWYRCFDKAIRWIDGRAARFELASDISSLKAAEAEARASEARFRTIAENSPDMIYRMSLPEGRYEYVSPAVERLFGYTPDEFTANPLIIRNIIHPDWHGYFQQQWERLLAGEVPPVYEYQIVTKDGETRWMNQRNVLARDEAGTPTAMWGIVTDVSQEKEASAALEKSRAELQQHRAQLEELVAERTASLDAANERLRGQIEERKQVQGQVEQYARITAATNRVFRETLTCEDEEEVAQVALQAAQELTGSAFGFIGLLNEEGKLDTIGLSNPGWEACSLPNVEASVRIQGMEVRGIWGEVVRTGRALIVADPTTHPSRVGLPKGHPSLERFLGVPLKRGDVTIGVVALANKSEPYTQEDMEAVGTLSGAFHEALTRKRMERELHAQAEIETALNALGEQLQGDPSLEQLCQNAIRFLCVQAGAPAGVIYVAEADGTLRRMGSYGGRLAPDAPQSFKRGEGLVGEVARTGQELRLDNVPESYFTIESGLGGCAPTHVYLRPMSYDRRFKGVIELGALQEWGPRVGRILDEASGRIAVAIESAQARDLQQRFLEETRRQAEELQTQQEELKSANEELEEQAQRLRQSEERLRVQQEELQVTNEELEEKNEQLERQKRDVEQARRELVRQAEDLAQASRYKSEFLANMSHELRTPLNSLLLLARNLMENKSGALTSDDVESAGIIYQSGNDLLSLINEILDLSRIEAGHLELDWSDIPVGDVASSMHSSFRHIADERGLDFEVVVAEAAPAQLTSDRKRLEQVLRNLISNALKFTEEGRVTVRFAARSAQQADGATSSPESAAACGEQLVVEVADTGIGIAPEHRRAIFEAFQQADGSTGRKYGGTGLGLSISKELVRLLGGDLQLESELGQGSTFRVVLPVVPRKQADSVPPAGRSAAISSTPPHSPYTSRSEPRAPAVSRGQAQMIPDDRHALDANDRVVLIVEDDPRFATILADQCRAERMKVLAATTGEAGLALAREYRPMGIVLDLKLPGMDGWEVLAAIKADPHIRHIPVHIMSVDAPSPRALQRGAAGYLQKPATREQIEGALDRIREIATSKTKHVLVVEDDEATRRSLVGLVGDQDVVVSEVATGEEALAALSERRYDCVILDLGLGDMDGRELLKRLEQQGQIDVPPIVIYTGRDLSWDENLDLRSLSDSIIIKDVRSDERLLDEVSLFLHRVVAEMPAERRQVIANLHDTNALLRGRKVLLVDDDMRALFALTKILAERDMEVLKAENGERALEILERHPDVDIVLMDIMMPVLDGLETMRRIRTQRRFAKLPIIALTAKAMKGDQEECHDAGASDYMAKPVDPERLLSMMRVWLYR